MPPLVENQIGELRQVGEPVGHQRSLRSANARDIEDHARKPLPPHGLGEGYDEFNACADTVEQQEGAARFLKPTWFLPG